MKRKILKAVGKRRGIIARGISYENPEKARLKTLLKKRGKMKGHWVGTYFVPD